MQIRFGTSIPKLFQWALVAVAAWLYPTLAAAQEPSRDTTQRVTVHVYEPPGGRPLPPVASAAQGVVTGVIQATPRHAIAVDFGPLIGQGTGSIGLGLQYTLRLWRMIRARVGGATNGGSGTTTTEGELSNNPDEISHYTTSIKTATSAWTGFVGAQFHQGLPGNLAGYVGIDVGYQQSRIYSLTNTENRDAPSIGLRNVISEERELRSTALLLMPHVGLSFVLKGRLLLGAEFRPYYSLGNTRDERSYTYTAYVDPSPTPIGHETNNSLGTGPRHEFTLRASGGTLRLLVGVVF